METHIKKELFCEVIESLRLQINKDGGNLNKSQLLIHSVMKLLHEYFPRDENGYSELENYVFFTNFGKESTESELFTAEELYDKLTKK